MTSSVSEARRREREYHLELYGHHQLGEAGTWLHRPAEYALRSLDCISAHSPTILDLGCGVGRHLLPILQRYEGRASAVGIDILPEAIDICRKNLAAASLSGNVKLHAEDITYYHPPKGAFDFILSVSCIEHADSEDSLESLIGQLRRATKSGGINCFMISTDVRWYAAESNRVIEPRIELNLSSTNVIRTLQAVYADWQIIDISTKQWSVPDILDSEQIENRSNCVQFTARRTQRGGVYERH